MYPSTAIFAQKGGVEGDLFLVLVFFESTIYIQGVNAHPNMAEKILIHWSIDIYITN